MDWSNYQLKIFEEIKTGEGNLIIEALAGSAKSTSLIEGSKYIKPGASAIFLAFNKIIASDLREKLSNNIETHTFHALGLKILGRNIKDLQVEQGKLDSIIDKRFKAKEFRSLKKCLKKIIPKAKSCLSQSISELDDLIDVFDLEIPSEMERIDFINQTLSVLDLCKQFSTVVDFDDMVWLAALLELKATKYDYVFVDEAQDISRSQLALIQKIIKPTSRIFFCLDQNQQIYQFRGIINISEIESTFKTKSLPLNICYRCPELVIKEAQKIVPALEVAPGAIKGKVERCSSGEMMSSIKLNDVVLSRSNAPLVALAVVMVKNNLPCYIVGRNIGDSLLSIINKSKAKTLDQLRTFVDKWQLKEIARLMKKDQATDSVDDKAKCLYEFIKHFTSLSELKENIQKLFSDGENGKITLSSIHKAKGKEWDDVYILKDTLRYFNQEEKNKQEIH